MKKLLLLLALVVADLTIAQTKLPIGTAQDKRNPYMFPDGTTLYFTSSDQFFYDGEGNHIKKVPLDKGYYPFISIDADKSWLFWTLKNGEIEIVRGDYEGKTTKTSLKSGAIKKYYTSFGKIEHGGKALILVTRYSPGSRQFNNDLIDYVVIEYDPATKSFNLQDYTKIPGIKGRTSFIGMHKGEKQFVNWYKLEKGRYRFQVLSVNDRKQVTTLAPYDFEYKKEPGAYIEGAPLLYKLDRDDYKHVYYAIHSISYTSKDGTMIRTPDCDYRICKVQEDGKTTVVDLKVPIWSNLGEFQHFPMYIFPENNEHENTFYVVDSWGNGLTFATDFTSAKPQIQPLKLPNAIEAVYFKDIFPSFYDALEGNYKAPYFFRLCDDGYARMLLKTGDKEFTLYKEKMP